MVLHHPARGAAGAAGVDDAGRSSRVMLAIRASVARRSGVALNQVSPVADGQLPAACVACSGSMLDDECPLRDAADRRGQKRLGQLRVDETITARARELSRTCR